MKNFSKFILISMMSLTMFACQRNNVQAQAGTFTVIGTGSSPQVHTGADTTYFKATISTSGTTSFFIKAVPTGTNPTDTGTIVWFASSDGVTYFPHPDGTNFASTSFSGTGVLGPTAATTAYAYSFNYSWLGFSSANNIRFVMARVISTNVGGTSSPSWTWSAYYNTRRGPGY